MTLLWSLGLVPERIWFACKLCHFADDSDGFAFSKFSAFLNMITYLLLCFKRSQRSQPHERSVVVMLAI